MFKKGNLYTHKRMLDCAFRVLEIVSNEEDFTSLYIVWFNRRGICLNLNDCITVNKSDFSHWFEFRGDQNDNV